MKLLVSQSCPCFGPQEKSQSESQEGIYMGRLLISYQKQVKSGEPARQAPICAALPQIDEFRGSDGNVIRADENEASIWEVEAYSWKSLSL